MTRYAVYAIPGADDAAPGVARRLRDAALAWYARDDVRDLVTDPVRYGFHATLKAPFRLADGVTEADLQGAVSHFAAGAQAVRIPAIRPAAIGRFRALVPGERHRDLAALAADVVAAFEPQRAALTPDEIARRRPERLTDRQSELLDAYGYPYVLDEFRFHMTLTDPVPESEAARIDQAIADHFAGLLGADIPLTALAVSVEPAPGAPFRLLSTHPLDAMPATTPEHADS